MGQGNQTPAPYYLAMGIQEVDNIVRKIAFGIEDAVVECMGENTGLITDLVREQIYSGLDGNGEYLNPTYDNDPYFNEPGQWYHRGNAYKKWKQEITPPMRGATLGLAPRPLEVPNLFITGPFHESIKAAKNETGVTVFTSGFRDGPLIERKYGQAIFALGSTAREYFILYKLKDYLLNFYRDCGV